MTATPKNLFPIITAGLVMGIIEAIVVMSLGTLIFSGDLDAYAGQGIGLALMSATISLVAIALFSQGRGIFGSVQDVSCAIFAVLAAQVMAKDTANPVLTVTIALGITTLLTGVFLWGVGYLKLAGFMRSLPYPVTGGLIAGTGWLLVKGGFEIMTDGAGFQQYAEPTLLWRWLPTFVFALVLLVGLRRFDHPFLMPSLLLGAIIIFYGGLRLMGYTLADIRAEELLMTLPSGGLYNPILPQELPDASWDVIFAQTGSIITILIMSAVLLILNINGLEVLMRQDMDLNKELEMVGITNGLIGLLGGMVSYHTLSTTALGKRFGAESRLFPLISAGVCGMALLVGGNLFTYFPKPILASLLVFIGLSFLMEWVVDSYTETHLARRDYVLIWLVLLTVALIGFLEGVLVGVLLTAGIFIVDYSRLEIVRHQFNGAMRRSKVNRSPEYEHLLDELGQRVLIFELQGFLFFGTAYKLYNRIKVQIETQAIDSLILDFRHVIRLDTSALYSLVKVKQLCASNHIQLLVSGAPLDIQAQLISLELRYFPDLDYALEFVENRLLEDHTQSQTKITPSTQTLDDTFSAQISTILLRYFKRREVTQGTVLAKQGESSDSMFYVEKGMLSVQLEIPDASNVRLRTITSGVLVGEVSWYLGLPRTASIIVDQPSVVYTLSRPDLEQIHTEHPKVAADIHLYMARLLADRLSDTTATLATALG